MSARAFVDFEIKADKDFSQVFLRFQKKHREVVASTLQSMGKVYADSIRQTFKQGGKRDNRPAWVIGMNPRPLHDTLRLFHSFGFAVIEDGDEITLSVGTDVPYARKMHEGFTGSIPVVWHGQPRVKGSLWEEAPPWKGTVPARPYLFLSKEDIEQFEKVFKESVKTFKDQKYLDIVQ